MGYETETMRSNQSNLYFIQNVMPDGVKYEDLPKLEHHLEFVGSTDYLDCIYPTHLTHHVMRGQDQYQRLYIVVYYKGNIQTYFQRYTDTSTSTWSYGEYLGGKKEDFVLPGCGNIAAQPDSMAKIKGVMTALLKSNEITEEERTLREELSKKYRKEREERYMKQNEERLKKENMSS